MELSLVIVSSLTTVTIMAMLLVVYLFRNIVKSESNIRKLSEDMKVAHNAQTDALEVVILKVQDMETRLSMASKRGL